jgi:hypothetical protein
MYYHQGASPNEDSMPTKKARISITVDDDHLAVLDRFAAASGSPRASIISQLIKSTSSELNRAARLMEIANAATPELLAKVASELGAASDAGMKTLLPVDTLAQNVIRRVTHRIQWRDSESGAGDALASPEPDFSPSRQPRPPRTNRGVKT